MSINEFSSAANDETNAVLADALNHGAERAVQRGKVEYSVPLVGLQQSREEYDGERQCQVTAYRYRA